MQIRSRSCVVATVLSGAMALAGSAFAHGGGPSGSSSGGSSSGGTPTDPGERVTNGEPATEAPDLTTCAKGFVWSKTKHACLVHRTGFFTDDELTDYAFSLAKAERYEEALQLLDGLQNADTPKAWNYRGYATRKLGRTEEGVGYYLKSVALDPNYTEVREYLGEAYVIQGKLDQAKSQLQTIERLCGNTACEEYEELSTAIKAAQPL